MGLNDKAWEKLFNKYKILEEIETNGEFHISSKQIKEFREPRLMTKFDHEVNLPKIFADNELAILPITRGDYVISSFSAYKKLDPISAEIQRVNAPSNLQSLIPQYIMNEAVALNFASASGILDDFLEDEDIIPTINGRMGSGEFEFDIETALGKKSVSVSNSQIEIDASFEGRNYFSLFEAKRDLSEDFLIRQLYYPFRVWKDRVEKDVKTVFMVFSNGVFNLYQYQFEDPQNYNSLVLTKQKNYVISREITLYDIEDILKNTEIVSEPEIQFPQADTFSRIVNLMELLYEHPMSNQEITEQYQFNSRQTNYYADAGRYLDLIEKEEPSKRGSPYRLTKTGKKIMGLEYKQRQLALAKQILKYKVFNETLKCHLKCGSMPSKNEIAKFMKDAKVYNVKSEETFLRRAHSVENWINWILELVED